MNIIERYKYQKGIQDKYTTYNETEGIYNYIIEHNHRLVAIDNKKIENDICNKITKEITNSIKAIYK